MKKTSFSIFLIYVLAIFNVQPASAVTNGTQATEGLAVKIITDQGNCTGAVWRTNIVLTAAHCVIQPSGVLATGISANAYVYDEWIKSEVAGIKIMKDYTTAVNHIYGRPSYSDIAFLILKNDLWDNLAFTNTRLATSSDWNEYKTAQTQLIAIGYGFTGESKTDFPYKSPVSAWYTLDVSQPSEGNDWAVFNSSNSALCLGDSGGPVIRYQADTRTIVIVGVIMGAASVGGNCGSFQYGSYSASFAKVSSFPGLAASTLITEERYRPSALVLESGFERLNVYKDVTSDFIDYAELLPLATKKRLFDNSKNVTALYTLIDDFQTKLNDQEELLNQSMEFTFINSGVLEANSRSVGAGFEASLKPFQTKIDALLVKIGKTLPEFVCTSGAQTKDLPSNKKCPKGYKKTELTKPF